MGNKEKTIKTKDKNNVIIIKAGQSSFHWKELSRYKDLIFLFAKRNISVKYKQTILGPLWLVIMPIISALVSSFVFGGIAKIQSGTIPYFLFYFVGFTIWSFLSSCFLSNSNIFVANASLFRKVYFPRISVVFSNLLCSLFTFLIQFIIMIIFVIVYAINGSPVQPVWSMIWIFPFLLIYVAALGLGLGAIFSSITSKYRDLTGVIPIAVDLWKYLTPVVYLTASMPNSMQWLFYVNPIAPIIECFRYIFLGKENGIFSLTALAIGFAETIVILLFGLWTFSRTERKFIDTV